MEESKVAVNRERHDAWARLGAKGRLVELRAEIAEILQTYPELRREEGSVGGRPGSRRRRHISAKARAAMSEGMRKYWARRRAQKGQKAQKSA
jgi:hypothetical protein